MIITASRRWSRSAVLNQWAETPWGGVLYISCPAYQGSTIPLSSKISYEVAAE